MDPSSGLGSFNVPEPSILSRSSSIHSSNLDSTTSLIDRSVSHFLEGITDHKTLLSLMAGGLVFRGLRAGVLTLGSQYLPRFPTVVRFGSSLVGLAGESATFTGVDRVLGGHLHQPGFAKEWASTSISLGALRVFGKVGEGQNPILQHLLVDVGFVSGHHFAALVNIQEKPEGDFLTQFVQADVINWQMKGAGALLTGLAPSLISFERTLDLRIQSQQNYETLKFFKNSLPRRELIFAENGASLLRPPFLEQERRYAHILKAAIGGDGKKGPEEGSSFSQEKVRGEVDPQRKKNRPKNSKITHLPFYPQALILQVLAQGPAYGLDIIKKIYVQSGRAYKIPASTVYPALNRMLKMGEVYVLELEIPENAPARTIYQLTERGHFLAESQRQIFRALAPLFSKR